MGDSPDRSRLRSSTLGGGLRRAGPPRRPDPWRAATHPARRVRARAAGAHRGPLRPPARRWRLARGAGPRPRRAAGSSGAAGGPLRPVGQPGGATGPGRHCRDGACGRPGGDPGDAGPPEALARLPGSARRRVAPAGRGLAPAGLVAPRPQAGWTRADPQAALAAALAFLAEDPSLRHPQSCSAGGDADRSDPAQRLVSRGIVLQAEADCGLDNRARIHALLAEIPTAACAGMGLAGHPTRMQTPWA